jgi:hypothetical protein
MLRLREKFQPLTGIKPGNSALTKKQQNFNITKGVQILQI